MREPEIHRDQDTIHRDRTAPVVIGVDVGSTTVKAVVVDPSDNAILWHDYARHHTRQPESVIEFLARIGNAFPRVAQEDVRIFVTGSGSSPLAGPLGAKFVQEVNAVTMAVEVLHPDVRSVIELGGQDAKIIILRDVLNADGDSTGDKRAIASMNDKCASGTGATIDKCFVKAGVPQAEVGNIRFDSERLHHVAAKCGVFAETDIVNLVKTGVPGDEILNSLADAIVMQNLSVLTRGNTLKPRVLLLGGPNTYLPFLVECWRLRIPQVWAERGLELPDISVQELIFVPDSSELYAALGAVFYGLHEAPEIGRYKGLHDLKTYADSGRKARLADAAGPPLAETSDEVIAFTDVYAVPKFELPLIKAGTKIRASLGLDGGSTSSKCVVVGENGDVLIKEYQLSKGNPISDMKEMFARLHGRIEEQGWDIEWLGFGVTGYAGGVLEKATLADIHVVETVAHMMSAVSYFGDVDVICDIGGQDIKVLMMRNGDIENFRLSNQCSAGNGMLLQAMADQFGVPVTEYATTAFEAELSPEFSYGCAVFLDADRVNFQKEGFSREEMLAGLALVLPKNVWQYVVQIPRMAELGTKYVLQGGTQYNLAAVKAQVDYIKSRVPGAEVFVHPHPGEAGAIGAAMEVLRRVKRVEGQGGTWKKSWIGLEPSINLAYSTKNDESTRCHFCPNLCSRTFIDTVAPTGETARYISGFSCEKGTVEDEAALKRLTRERARLRRAYPNLVEWESKNLFKSRFKHDPLPSSDTMIDGVETKITRSLAVERKISRRGFHRSSQGDIAWRSNYRVGIPRVLNIWSTAPFWRTYFEALGIQRQNVVFSDYTSEEMWAEGGKYGSIDPCFPSKVAQAHIHNLLFHKHDEKPLNAVFLPTITHVRTPLVGVMDHASCPIVQGVGNVMHASFTKEKDFFAERSITWLDPSVSFTEHHLLADQMFGAWGDLLRVTRDESNFACEQAWRALDDYEAAIANKGRLLLEEVERNDDIALLMIGRPYHSDPGLNHEVLQEFQSLGYPILSMSSIPRDKAWLARYFREDLRNGVPDVHDINDVWPENYSANSAFKVWCAKFAARHPNVAVLDLSSFKCGHDSPIYATIDGIIGAAATPYSALHDIDANKPGGSIGIRVRTYSYTLERHRERLEDVARKRRELEQRIADKQAELRKRYEAEKAQKLADLAEATANRPEPINDGYTDRFAKRMPDNRLTRGAFVGLGKLRDKARAFRQRVT